MRVGVRRAAPRPSRYGCANRSSPASISPSHRPPARARPGAASRYQSRDARRCPHVDQRIRSWPVDHPPTPRIVEHGMSAYATPPQTWNTDAWLLQRDGASLYYEEHGGFPLLLIARWHEFDRRLLGSYADQSSRDLPVRGFRSSQWISATPGDQRAATHRGSVGHCRRRLGLLDHLASIASSSSGAALAARTS